MYKHTTCILGSTTITSVIGVRQGSPTSCFLFVIYVDMLIRMIKQNVSLDGFLGWLHCLMLMDDTIIMATTRDLLVEKLSHLGDYCEEYGMVINEDKTKLLVINGDDTDRRPIQLGDVTILNAKTYVYLGAVVTEDGSTATSITEHAKEKLKSVNKLIIFLASNHDAPFHVKKKVFDAAFSSSILYSMESWIGFSTKSIESMYMKGVKALLGVRSSIPDNLCLIEAGLPPLESVVLQAQGKFFNKMMHRMDMEDDPLGYVLRLIEREDPWMWEKIISVMSTTKHVEAGRNQILHSVFIDPGRRSSTYKHLNPDLSVHIIYTRSAEYIPDSLRIGFTRVRLSSHRLKIETGRWSQTPRYRRICSCGCIQDEEHILKCQLNKTILSDFQYLEASLGLNHLFENMDVKNLTLLNKLLEATENQKSLNVLY